MMAKSDARVFCVVVRQERLGSWVQLARLGLLVRKVLLASREPLGFRARPAEPAPPVRTAYKLIQCTMFKLPIYIAFTLQYHTSVMAFGKNLTDEELVWLSS